MTCAHENRHLVWTDIGKSGNPLVGEKVLRQQCLDCGELSSRSIDHSKAKPDTPDVDRDAVVKWNAQRESFYKNRKENRLLEQERERREYLLTYATYLKSSEWQEKSHLVMRRANFNCEGCARANAVEVHHLTYDHIGNEFLWELVAVCRECHRRWHGT